ncbi:MAG: type II toxin-antitoxin system RelE/ParE family toxin [Bacteroidetes bacterium]|nr:type II toxin-antitoxin system RelE/ParE family toxin [Bacteroidota bacterium]MBS1940053.1 type II toxin-antitoxin system RelE/ParE family toxin [Bacteroidota bacterium]
MPYRVIPTPVFRKKVKALLKKYRSLREELMALEAELKRDPHMGTSLGHGVFKVRVAIKSKGKGKSGGARLITYVITEDKEVYLLSIYDKSEMDSLDAKAIKELISQVSP